MFGTSTGHAIKVQSTANPYAGGALRIKSGSVTSDSGNMVVLSKGGTVLYNVSASTAIESPLRSLM